ncbi:MAG TPA: nitronate monooxygenase [Acidimicrobiales bacterium]|jgi:enoyl-[acyl-carrier protein] reductase II|nr:nitronate monooxygenase [Acidimicrobiales bacterium]
MRTRLTETLDVEHPVMLAGMGGVSFHELVAAVSEAGGYGCIGAAAASHEEMVAEIAATRARTSKPFGVDLLTAAPQDIEAKIRDIAKGGATSYVAGLGVPRDVIELCHELNLLVMSMCGKVRHAVAAVEAGCDIVVAQGTEAGGHTGTVATMALVPQVVDAVGDRVPVVAAGGIFDGRGLAAALSLGADGVWVGTRFIATPEAHTVKGYKDRLLATPEDGTIVTRAYTGKTCRVVRTSYVDDFEAAGGEPLPFPGQVLQSWQDGVNHLGAGPETTDVDIDREFMPAGQGVGAIHELVPAGELVHRFVAEAEAALGRVDAAR